MISGDKNLLAEGSEAYQRFKLQRSQVETLDLYIWPQVHSLREILRAARTNHYDVITVQDPFWRGLLGLKLAWLTGTRLDVQVHADLDAQSLVKHVLSQIVLRHADSIRVVSERIRTQVERIATRAKITVLPVFVDIARYEHLEHKPQAQKIILWVGRLEHEKDPLLAVEVLQQILVKGIDARLVMLGSGSLGTILHEKALVLPIDLPGWQDPRPYVALADVVLSTSKHESWGVSIIEALAAGVPVVAPDVGIAKEAGAIVVPNAELGNAAAEVLRAGVRGELKLSLPTADEWAKKWRETLA